MQSQEHWFRRQIGKPHDIGQPERLCAALFDTQLKQLGLDWTVCVAAKLMEVGSACNITELCPICRGMLEAGG